MLSPSPPKVRPSMKFEFGEEGPGADLAQLSPPVFPTFEDAYGSRSEEESSPSPAAVSLGDEEIGHKSARSFSSLRKSIPRFSINTDRINLEFPVGGNDDKSESELLLEEATSLAATCVQYMTGELVINPDERDYPLPPVLTIRGESDSDQSSSGRSFEKPMPQSARSAPAMLNEEELIYRTILEMLLKRPFTIG
jgi:hypothetical protein